MTGDHGLLIAVGTAWPFSSRDSALAGSGNTGRNASARSRAEALGFQALLTHTAKLLAFLFESGERCLGPLFDQVALFLSQGGVQMQHERLEVRPNYKC
jgi:hypothetical protein